MSDTFIINGQAVTGPEGAVAFKYGDPTENAMWLFSEEDVAEVAHEDPSLIVRPTTEQVDLPPEYLALQEI